MSIPKRIDKYHVLDVVGSGSMGTVYTAYDSFSDRDVAIKVCAMGPEDVKGEDALTRNLFLNEAQIASSLDHPNIVRILDAGEHVKQPYIVMEHLGSSKTLKSWCGAPVPVEKVASVIYKCARALDYAHRRGVIHCDIKPSNIMLTAEGDAKIGDFGIAKWALTESAVEAPMGSPLYMSAEQTRRGELTHQTDLYSLGVVMYELLAGRPPFRAPTLMELLEVIRSEEPPSIRELRPEVPEGIEYMLDCALAKDPVDRYQSGGEMASDLAAVFSEIELLHSGLSDDEKFRMVRDLEFFEEFRDDEVWEVARACLWESHSPEDCIISEGTMEFCFYIITAGDVAVRKRGVELRTLARGDCFGEMGLMANAVRTATIVAKDEVSLIKISASMMEQSPVGCQLRFNKAFVRTLVERLSQVSDELTTSELPYAATA